MGVLSDAKEAAEYWEENPIEGKATAIWDKRTPEEIAAGEEKKAAEEKRKKDISDQWNLFKNMTPETFNSSKEYQAQGVIDAGKEAGANDQEIWDTLSRLYGGVISEKGQSAIDKNLKNFIPKRTEGERTKDFSALKKETENVSAISDQEKDAAEKQVEQITKSMEGWIDPNYIENLPRNIWTDFSRGEFGRPKIDEELEKQFETIKDKKPEEMTDEEKKIAEDYATQKAEVKTAKNTKGHLILNAIATGLMNFGNSLAGRGGNVESDYRKIQGSKMGDALDRYNKKYRDIAQTQTEMFQSTAANKKDIENTLTKIYANAKTREYITRLDLDNKKILVDYIANMGKNINLKDIPALLAGLLVYQQTDKLPGSTAGILEKAGQGVEKVMGFIPGVGGSD